MKTKEIRKILEDFCQKLEETKTDNDFNYEIEETYSQIGIEKSFKDEVGDYVVMVNKVTERYQIIIDEVDGITSSDLQVIFKAVKEYADTSLEERKDEKRWYIHLLEDSDEYLNLYKGSYIDKGHYMLSDNEEQISYQTKFTRSDIEDWLGTKDPKIIDWFISKFGQEVKE